MGSKAPKTHGGGESSITSGWRVHYEGEVHVDGVESPQDTWWGRVIDHFDGRLVANSSFSGSVVEGYGFPAGNSEKRITSLLGAQGECPDVVLVYMGIIARSASLRCSARRANAPMSSSCTWALTTTAGAVAATR